jgi:hypothetical protein
MRVKSKLLAKRSADWGAEDTRWHQREDSQAVKSVWNGIANKVHQLKNSLQVKGQSLGQFLSQHSMADLFSSPDPEVKRTGYQLRSLINQFVAEEFDANVLTRFKAEAGNNVTDWLAKDRKVGRKTRPSTGLRMHPDYGEAGSYTTEANKENAKAGSPQFVFKAKFLQK